MPPEAQLALMGPMSRAEKITLAILLITLLCWMTEKLHGVPAAVVAMLAVCVLLSLNVFDRVQFRSGIAWDALLFLGGVVGIGSVFPALGIDKWLGNIFAPFIVPLAGNVYLFIIGLSIVVYILRIAVLSQTALIAILILIFTPLASQSGISPWILGMVIYTTCNTWTLFYQNTPYVAAYYAAGGTELVSHGQVAKLSVAYMIFCVIGLLLCVPLWQMMGLIK